MEVKKQQLDQALELTGGKWLAVLQRTPEGWTIRGSSGLSRRQAGQVGEWLGRAAIDGWLSGALHSQRIRHSSNGPLPQTGLRVYFVPAPGPVRAGLMIQATSLDTPATNVLRLLASLLPNLLIDSELQPVEEQTGQEPVLQDIELEWGQDLAGVFAQLTGYFQGQVPSRAAYLAVRRGDVFIVQAAVNWPESIVGQEVRISESRELLSMVETCLPVSIASGRNTPGPVLGSGILPGWMAAPVVLGQRVIGMVVFFAINGGNYSQKDQLLAERIVHRAASLVENAILYSEAARHLDQLALLNELAATASTGLDTDQVALRVLRRLRRVFRGGNVALLLLSADSLYLREYEETPELIASNNVKPAWVPLAGTLEGRVVATGKALRYSPETEEPKPAGMEQGMRSALSVPLKYRGRVIGALRLTSPSTGAFSLQDEKMLSMVASHLAGLMENVRLNEETRRRAGNLMAIHQIVQRIVGLDQRLEIAQQAVTLIAAQFDFERVAIYLPDETESVFQRVATAPALSAWDEPASLTRAEVDGLIMNLGGLEEGQFTGALLDQKTVDLYMPIQDGRRLIGMIQSERIADHRPVEQDRLTLQALSGVLGSVLTTAERYQELQQRMHAQREAEDQLIRSARLAAVGEMVAGVAHELNNPLTTVTGFIELVLDELPPDATQRADLELVLREARRARGVVRRLLDFSRSSETQQVRSDVNELVDDVTQLVRHLARTNGVTIRTNLADALPWVQVDPNQIKQVLLNLVHNAIQAMPNGGYINLDTNREVRDQRDWVTIAVQDSGLGISEEHMKRIFEPFFTTQPVGAGTGLGLSVSYGIVTQHGGFIEVDSKMDEGSTFTVWLSLSETNE